MSDDIRRADPEWGRRTLGELYERWPRDDAGEPEPPVYLCHCTGLDMDEALLTSRMDTYGIPLLRQYPNDGAFGKVILGMSGSGVDMFVPASLWADATELLKEPEEGGDDE